MAFMDNLIEIITSISILLFFFSLIWRNELREPIIGFLDIYKVDMHGR